MIQYQHCFVAQFVVADRQLVLTLPAFLTSRMPRTIHSIYYLHQSSFSASESSVGLLSLSKLARELLRVSVLSREETQRTNKCRVLQLQTRLLTSVWCSSGACIGFCDACSCTINGSGDGSARWHAFGLGIIPTSVRWKWRSLAKMAALELVMLLLLHLNPLFNLVWIVCLFKSISNWKQQKYFGRLSDFFRPILTFTPMLCLILCPASLLCEEISFTTQISNQLLTGEG